MLLSGVERKNEEVGEGVYTSTIIHNSLDALVGFMGLDESVFLRPLLQNQRNISGL